MPELPEVEVAARNLRRWLDGRRITAAHFGSTRILRGATPASLENLVRGRKVAEVVRRGKWIRLVLDGGAALYSHLGMTGKWVRMGRADPPASHERLRLDTARGSVRYRDPRLFGRLIAAPDGEPPAPWRELGPDPLVDGIDPQALGRALSGKKGSIKEVLLDQSVLAGIGNIQATEALWRARINPKTRASALDGQRLRALAEAIAGSIADTLAREDGPEITYVEEAGADNPFAVYAKYGQPCPRCGSKLARLIQGGRTTSWCPRCQRR